MAPVPCGQCYMVCVNDRLYRHLGSMHSCSSRRSRGQWLHAVRSWQSDPHSRRRLQPVGLVRVAPVCPVAVFAR